MKIDPAFLAAPEYRRFIEDLKARVTAARISAARHVNRDLILLYWDIGRAIDDKQHILGWGESVIDRISDDLRAAFPAATGFSPRNLRDMKRFFLAYTVEAIWRQAVAKLAEGAAPGIRRQPVAELSPYEKCLLVSELPILELIDSRSLTAVIFPFRPIPHVVVRIPLTNKFPFAIYWLPETTFLSLDYI